ncbi:MAG: hypothetical protein E7463_05360 [Ruminococcaceae bacterium]|nr:hypothetical protein [Oscillospiraceae bacterium]
MNPTLSLNGKWLTDYISELPYTDAAEPQFPTVGADENRVSQALCDVPGYWEDQYETFRTTYLHTKLHWNPLYTLQRYPQAGYVPDMALPNPVGCFMHQRRFTVGADSLSADTRLRIGGAQNTVSAWINGQYLGRHEGYSVEFYFDIPAGVLKAGENTITLAVSNNRLAGYMGRPVSGLTSRAANECTGGIYGDVEICFCPDGLRDAWITVAADCSAFTVHTAGTDAIERTVKILDGKRTVTEAVIPAGESCVTIDAAGFERWSPASPRLYTAVVTTAHQTLSRRFGVRRLTVDGTRLFLNGEPYFFRGTCEHCYHPLTVHPTREKNYYRNVIRTLKGLGFNSIRFHTWVPMDEYLEAADELGILIEVETPNNTTFDEWCEIVAACRRHTSAIMYSSGNEMVIDEDYIEHLRKCADLVHTGSDSLFSPMSAMRGIEYHSYGDCRVDEPFPHNPRRLAELGKFCDVYNTYSLGLTSYTSDKGDHELLDHRNSIYGKPLLTHEICIQGTYIDLSLQSRYRGSRIGDTEFMSSVEKHLENNGLLDHAPVYYRNSAHWQSLQRKHCFETVRRCNTFAGYDFLGDIDTHWHTFGYCVGMMNEFYELKPGETVANVLRYNSDVVLLTDLPECRNFAAGEKVEIPVLVSNYGKALDRAVLRLRVNAGSDVLLRREVRLSDIPAGAITNLYTLSFTMPRCEKPTALKLTASLSGGNTDAENCWDLYVFPKAEKLPSARALKAAGVIVADTMDAESLLAAMKAGKRVVLFGAGPFSSLDVTFQLSVAGRTTGHLATVIEDHPLMQDFPHDGYCSWQFRQMMNDSCSAVVELPRLPHKPIIDIASAYKNVRREALLFEYAVGAGKLIVCTLNLREDDPGAQWLKAHIVSYAMGEDFAPAQAISVQELAMLCHAEDLSSLGNTNEAFNANDITMKTLS